MPPPKREAVKSFLKMQKTKVLFGNVNNDIKRSKTSIQLS